MSRPPINRRRGLQVPSHMDPTVKSGGLLERPTPKGAVPAEKVRWACQALCRAEGTAQCAAICLQRFASSNQDGKCPDAVRVWTQFMGKVVGA